MAITAEQVLEDMFVTLVHQMPDRRATIAPESLFEEGQGDAYSGHELRFRIEEGVIEAFCYTCEEAQEES